MLLGFPAGKPKISVPPALPAALLRWGQPGWNQGLWMVFTGDFEVFWGFLSYFGPGACPLGEGDPDTVGWSCPFWALLAAGWKTTRFISAVPYQPQPDPGVP